jgi:maltooligosyltrehalose trehalohydrolase
LKEGLECELGTTLLGSGECSILVWAPYAQTVRVHFMTPHERLVSLTKLDRGYHGGILTKVQLGSTYAYRLDRRKERPDPASRLQPNGVHQPSRVVDSEFDWSTEEWSGLNLDEYIIYEIHVGTYTSEGTFHSIIPHLRELTELGVTAVELMPVGQFPGKRNWGYDGVYPYAVQNSYGGPAGLKRLVNACHAHGLAVILDVVYNHLGPEGNYLADYGPYFSDRYRTPWGQAINFDGPCSDEVRRYFVENALRWVSEFRIDALRLDAVHAILDISPKPFLHELTTAVHERAKALNRRVYLIAESDLNDRKLVLPSGREGLELDAIWNDDFHHALHALLTKERDGYYQDYGTVRHLAKAVREGFVYTGEYSAYRRHRHGSPSSDIPSNRLVVFDQNHDQVGNRKLGERLGRLVPFEKVKLAASLTLLCPFVPLLFMGEEYGEPAPFLYFVSHSNRSLIKAVRKGRKQEGSASNRQEAAPDPQDSRTFERSKLNHDCKSLGDHHVLLDFYKTTIKLRKEIPALATLRKGTMHTGCFEDKEVLYMHRWNGNSEVFAIFNFSESNTLLKLPIAPGTWCKRLDSAEKRWKGSGSSIQDAIPSKGEVSLQVNPCAVVILFHLKQQLVRREERH